MTAELGGQTGLIAADEVTKNYLGFSFDSWDSDPDAPAHLTKVTETT